MDYDLSKEDALGLQLELSPLLPLINSPYKMHTSLDFNREDDQELPAEAEDDKEDKGEVEELLVIAIGTGLSINHPYTAVQAVLNESDVPIGNSA